KYNKISLFHHVVNRCICSVEFFLSFWLRAAAVINNIHIKAEVGTFCDSLSYISHARSEEHTSELQSRFYIVCRLLLEKKKIVSREFIQIRFDICKLALYRL